MTRITIDADTWAKLMTMREVAELSDEKGRVVGYYHPGPPRDENGNIIVPFSEEEIEEFSKQKGGRPLKEIFDDWSRLSIQW